jgi:pentatricopeptide repeat protein
MSSQRWVNTNKAFELWNEMLYKGLKPDIVAYNILIRWCGIHGQFYKGLGIYSGMLKNGVQPNWDTYGALGASMMTPDVRTIFSHALIYGIGWQNQPVTELLLHIQVPKPYMCILTLCFSRWILDFWHLR